MRTSQFTQKLAQKKICGRLCQKNGGSCYGKKCRQMRFCENTRRPHNPPPPAPCLDAKTAVRMGIQMEGVWWTMGFVGIGYETQTCCEVPHCPPGVRRDLQHSKSLGDLGVQHLRGLEQVQAFCDVHLQQHACAMMIGERGWGRRMRGGKEAPFSR